jgi:hypothetical protein
MASALRVLSRADVERSESSISNADEALSSLSSGNGGAVVRDLERRPTRYSVFENVDFESSPVLLRAAK